MSYIELKSGTDIRGVASPLGGSKVNLTEQAVYDITAAFVVWYINKYDKNPTEMSVAVGHDSRITAEKIKANLISLDGVIFIEFEVVQIDALAVGDEDPGAVGSGEDMETLEMEEELWQ